MPIESEKTTNLFLCVSANTDEDAQRARIALEVVEKALEDAYGVIGVVEVDDLDVRMLLAMQINHEGGGNDEPQDLAAYLVARQALSYGLLGALRSPFSPEMPQARLSLEGDSLWLGIVADAAMAHKINIVEHVRIGEVA